MCGPARESCTGGKQTRKGVIVRIEVAADFDNYDDHIVRWMLQVLGFVQISPLVWHIYPRGGPR